MFVSCKHLTVIKSDYCVMVHM